MKIETTHTLSFAITCMAPQHVVALGVIDYGAEKYKLAPVETSALPLPDGADPATRSTLITVKSSDMEVIGEFQREVAQALHFIGVTAKRP